MARMPTGSSPYRSVVCTGAGVAFITASGRVFVYGAVAERCYTKPTMVCDATHDHASFTQIFAGASDLALVDDDGGLYMLAHDNKKRNVLRIPADTFGGSAVHKVAFGFDIALFLTLDNELFTAGRPACAATGCGVNVKAEVLKKTLRLQHRKNVVRRIKWGQENTTGLVGISCDKRICAVWSRDAVWVWGESAIHLLGSSWGEWGVDVYTPTKVQGLHFGDDAVKEVSISEHIAVVSEAGEAYLWGDNRSGQLATGDLVRRFTPCKLSRDVLGGASVRSIRVSSMHTAFLTDKGEVWNVGFLINDVHQDVYREPMLSFGMERVMEIDCGYKHAVAVNEEGVLYVWGWELRALASGVLQEPKLSAGSDVRVYDLRTRTDLNGRMGKILKDMDHASGRYEVEIRGYSTEIEPYCYSRVKAAHLKHIRDHAIPKAVLSSWFEHEPVGLWHQLSAKKVLAFAMALHARLGSDSAAFGLLPELLRQIVARNALAR
jgi:hypothetical protein